MFAADEAAEPCIISDSTRCTKANWLADFLPRSQFSHVCAFNIIYYYYYILSVYDDFNYIG